MRKLLGVAAVLCLTALTSYAADEKKADKDALEQKADQDALNGTWDMVGVEIGGMKQAIPKGMELSLTFKSGKVTKKEPGKKDEDGTYKLDETKKPKQIDLTTPKNDKPTETETMKGLYQIDGDTFKIYFVPKENAPRPTAYDGKDVAVMIFKRKK